ncbi:MAG: ABC transporter ATP-binding protein [Alphaproteobacteria bacterium]
MAAATRVERLQEARAFALEASGLSRRFGALSAVEDIDLSIRAGERHAVLGSNGAGKTTLFNLISGDFPPSSGRIRFFGEDVTAMPVHERIRRGLRRTYQISQLFQGLTIFENLYLATRGVTRGRYSLRRGGANDAAHADTERLLHAVNLEDQRDVRVAELSHGQQRQLEIGMALAGAPRLVLLDEPAAGLSPAERRDLIAILTSLPAHIGYIIIEHDLDVALRVAERVTMMHNGRIFLTGTPAEIEANARVQEIYLRGAHG